MYHTHTCVSSMCLMDVMVIVGDRMLPEVLAMVARCSGELHLAITPLLKIRMQDVTEMRQLVFRLYPTIFDHQENQTLKFYLQLIAHVTAPILDFHALRPYIVCILDGRVNQDAIKFVFSAMRHRAGRWSIRLNIKKWEKVGVKPEVRARAVDLRNRVDGVVRELFLFDHHY